MKEIPELKLAIGQKYAAVGVVIIKVHVCAI